MKKLILLILTSVLTISVYSQNRSQQQCANEFISKFAQDPYNTSLSEKIEFLESDCSLYFKNKIGVEFVAYQAYWTYIEGIPKKNKDLLRVFRKLINAYDNSPDYIVAGMQLSVAMDMVLLNEASSEEVKSEFLKYRQMIRRCHESGIDRNYYHQEHYDYGMKVLGGLESDINNNSSTDCDINIASSRMSSRDIPGLHAAIFKQVNCSCNSKDYKIWSGGKFSGDHNSYYTVEVDGGFLEFGKFKEMDAISWIENDCQNN